MALTAVAPAQKHIVTSVMHITPDLAAQWLERNSKNRTLTKAHVERLAAEIRAGLWQVNGEAIKFGVSDALVDGQHRLAAVILAGRAIDSVVMWHVPDTAFETLDSGRKRKAADALSIEGIKNYSTVAGAAKLKWQYDRHSIYTKEHPSTREIVRLVEETPELVDAAHAVNRPGVWRMVQPSVAAWLYYETTRRDAAAAETFWARLESGEHLTSDSPIHRLRERLQDNRASKAKLLQPDVAGLVVIAWNHYWKGHSIRALRPPSADVPAPERFPVIGPQLRAH